MLSSVLGSPFDYTSRVKDGPSIIYMAAIQGEIRDVYWEESRHKMRQKDVDAKKRSEMNAGKIVAAGKK